MIVTSSENCYVESGAKGAPFLVGVFTFAEKVPQKGALCRENYLFFLGEGVLKISFCDTAKKPCQQNMLKKTMIY